ncbi:hypothetical protein [Pseudodesulfovibrio sp.]|uniref:hypothetical protein n=1 Tax=unclassified Pseudodesulfovibrio TaxID=2661612 RepID=UPI003B00BE5C
MSQLSEDLKSQGPVDLENTFKRGLQYEEFRKEINRLSQGKDLLEKIKTLLNVNTNIELAEVLGVSAQAITKAKGKIPDRWTLFAAAQTHIPYHCILNYPIDILVKMRNDYYVIIDEVDRIEYSADNRDKLFQKKLSHRTMILNRSLAHVDTENRTVMYRAKTTEMEPTIAHNDFLFVEEFNNDNKQISNNSVYIIWLLTRNTLLLGRISLSSDSYKISFDKPGLDDLIVNPDDIVFFGRVLGKVKVTPVG